MAIDPADGRPWVLLPGTLCTGAVFDRLLDALHVPDAARRALPLDHDGVRDYAPALTEAASPGAVVCGFSLGAIVAAHLADRLPVATIVLFGLNPHADDPAKRQGRLDLAGDVARLGGADALTSRLGPLAGPDPEGARAHILAMAEASTAGIGAQTALALNRPGALAALSRAAAPIVLLTGTDDTQAPLPLAREAAQAAPKARVIPLEGLGHYALCEDPALCARALGAHFGMT